MQTASNRAPRHADKGGGWAGEEVPAPPLFDVVDVLNDRTRRLLEEEGDEDDEKERVD